MIRQKAVFFRSPLPTGLHPTRYVQEDELLARLRCNFDVTVVEEDADYRAVLDVHRPAVALFESGKDAPHRRIRVTGVANGCGVPKLLLARCDPYAPLRVQVLENCERWDVDGVFTYDPLYRRYLPALADRLYFMPHSVDVRQFRDFGLEKTAEVMLFGKDLPHRRWRMEMLPLLRRHFLCTFAPHDMEAGTPETRMAYGERYARLLNAARFVPAEGSVARLPVRKFFEIPACRACLVTEPGPALAPLGFVDMVNCVIADGCDIVEKIDHLAGDPQAYARVTDAGMALVQTRHTHEHRRHLAEWLTAWQARAPGQHVVQTGLLGGFVAMAPPAAGLATPTATRDRAMLEQGVAWLELGELDLAEACLRRCLDYLPGHFSEPLFFLGLCRLMRGDPQQALYLIMKNFVQRLLPVGSTAADPLETAYGAIAYLCNGQPERAARLAALHGGRRHPDLARAAWLAAAAQGAEEDPPADDGAGASPTLYPQLVPTALPQWLDRVARMAEASGQLGIRDLCRRWRARTVLATLS